MPDQSDDALVADLLAAYDAGGQIAPLSDQLTGLDFARAYRIAARIAETRRARGERTVGRKIGFTNRTIWPLYGVDRPMWGWMWETTVHRLPDGPTEIELPALPEPRLEPEIAFRLSAAPRPGMTEAELAGCIDWVSHGFEVVFSPFPGWRFQGADTAAAFGLHGALYLGPIRPLSEIRLATLSDFGVALDGSNGTPLTGRGADVLGGPLSALRYLIETLADVPEAEPLKAGEIVTTGTLTDAAPVAPGETWRTKLSGLDLPGLEVRWAD